jgi:hypothetical protein
MVLIAVRSLDQKRILEKSLPLLGELPLYQMGHNKELLIIRAFVVDERHLFISGQKFVVNSHYERSSRLLLFLDELKILDIVNLDIFHFNFILRLQEVDPFLV